MSVYVFVHNLIFKKFLFMRVYECLCNKINKEKNGEIILVVNRDGHIFTKENNKLEHLCDVARGT